MPGGGEPGPTPSGRVPVGDCRVGCIGRRSPGRNGGRVPGAAAPPGRGRWKIGWPGTGRPGTGRAGAPAWAVGAGRGGALYTGRGPVCGMIMRGDGDCAIGAAGFAAIGAGGCGGTTGGTAETGGAACATAGVTTGGLTGRGGTGIAGGAAADTGGWATGGAGTEKVGLTVGVGTMTRGGRTTAAGGATGAGVEVTAVGPAAATGRGGGAGTATLTGACCLRMAFRTSPGREILERSILVLISSLSMRAGRECFAALCVSPAPRK